MSGRLAVCLSEVPTDSPFKWPGGYCDSSPQVRLLTYIINSQTPNSLVCNGHARLWQHRRRTWNPKPFSPSRLNGILYSSDLSFTADFFSSNTWPTVIQLSNHASSPSNMMTYLSLVSLRVNCFPSTPCPPSFTKATVLGKLPSQNQRASQWISNRWTTFIYLSSHAELPLKTKSKRNVPVIWVSQCSLQNIIDIYPSVISLTMEPFPSNI